MNFYVLNNGLNALLAIAIMFLVIRKKDKERVHKDYLLWLLFFTLWTGSYFFWGMEADRGRAALWMKLLIASISFIHVSHVQFLATLSGDGRKYKKLLILGYALGVIFVYLNYKNYLVDLSNVYQRGMFLYWPSDGPLLWVFVFVQVFYVTYGIWILRQRICSASGPLKTKLKLLEVGTAIAWTGGLTNWFYFFNIPIPPFGNILVSLYLVATYYLIFRHDLLGLNIFVQKTFVYTLLTLFISVIYVLFTLGSEKIFQNMMGYNSFPITILAAFTIALLFNPLRSFLFKFIEKFTFGKNIIDMSKENSLLFEEVQKQDHLKSVATLAAGMAHEIKNPLSAIKTFTEYLPAKGKDPEFLEKFEKIVGLEVNKIDLIVRQVLEFSKPVPPKLEATDIHWVLDQTLEFLNNEFIKHKVLVEKSFMATHFQMDADKTQLKQVFLNLFLNSIQAMPQGGTLKISTSNKASSTGAKLLIQIEDTGCGISKENLKEIFDPFFTTKESGTGLGLAIVRGIVKEHDGEIGVQSKVSEGTTFWMRFKARK